MTDLWRLPATDLAALVRDRQVSATEATRSALARLDAVNPRINAVIQHDPAQPLAVAAAVDAAIARGEDPGPLAGVPITVKVNVDQQGWATTNGLALQKDLVAQQDSPVVANLRKAGAIILGRTNTPAFSLRWFTRNLLHGATTNPRDPSITPGGSSGGAAACVAAGIGALAHGTDIGGSVRYPAYACGIHGIRPTLGRIPAWNATGPDRGIGAQLMAVSGPLARTIGDLRLALGAMSQPDARDPWWVPAPLDGPPVPQRAALCIAPDGMPVQPEVAAALRDAGKRLQAAGWEVEEVPDLPPLQESADIQLLLWLAESRRAGTGVYEREGDPDALAIFGYMERLCAEPSLFDFQDALQKRVGLLRQWLLFLERYPVVIMPVSGALPYPNHPDVESFEGFRRMMAEQLPQLGLPVLGLPGMTVSTGLVGRVPVGVQLVGGRYREDVLLAAGAAIEARGVPAAPIDPA
ncbi:amidase [Dankookia rubra]|uniref:Amidase n=1 Tax=Dankookia rubra TaxID=1442381 RepID=A0A4R5QBS1_9PROT|nr:amidase family protein [Dankookia rubra]TDH60039.1 amidase [Dankookia rubra]